MKRLHFDYYMQIEYAVAVSRCSFTIKCIPTETKRQKPEKMEISLTPEVPYSWGVDGLKNQQIYGLNEEPHNTFRFQITGDIRTGLSEYEEEEEESRAMIFRHPHGLNVAGAKIRDYYEKIKPEEGQNDLVRAEAIMHCLYRDFQYQQNTTNVNTTAEEAMELGHGVCQDYAHIFISLLHLSGIPARYVTGLLIGEGASHAWVEILYDHKWYGLDPTNNIRVAENHIRIGIGRDARDCMINRGIMHGGGLHTQKIKATVKEAGENQND